MPESLTRKLKCAHSFLIIIHGNTILRIYSEEEIANPIVIFPTKKIIFNDFGLKKLLTFLKLHT